MTHRAFTGAEEFKPHRHKWWRYKNDHPSVSIPPAEHSDRHHNNRSWEWALEHKIFEDGSPFGVEVKNDE